jgi:acyl-coenzyme A thioesterase PaaI-like protein
VSNEQQIRDRVLRGIALNRTPGFHFAGNFLSPSYDHVSVEAVHASLNVGPYCVDANGGINYGALAVFADLAVASNVRAGHDRAARLATVNMNMHFTGAPMTGRIEAKTALQGYVVNSTSRQGAGTVTITANGQPVCFGTGAFMVLSPPKGVALYAMELRRESDPEVPLVPESEFTRDERMIIQHADDALAVSHDGAFIRRFWGINTHALNKGAAGILKNGPHVGNRVGHLQGGITMGLGMATAETALPTSWMISAVSAWFISPGEGRVIKAKSKIIHHGRLTSVVRTQITGKNNRRVMEMVTTHAHKAA